MTARAKAQKEIFTSHASENETTARRIADALTALEEKVGYSPIPLHAADASHDEIGKALNRCRWLVVLLNPASVRPHWGRRKDRFPLMVRQFLDIRAKLPALQTPSTMAAAIGRSEELLLDELLDWKEAIKKW